MASAILADAAGHEHGGMGECFDWKAVAAVRSELHKPLVIAGGLREQNVREAITLLHPWAVDVASGVETARGIKDHDKILNFMQAVRRGGDVTPTQIALD